MSPSAAQIAENIAVLRQRKGMSQRDICRVVGMADSTLSHKLKGKADWALRDLEAVSRALDVTVSELVGDLPPRDDWDRRRRAAAVSAPAAPERRYLVRPETNFDAPFKPLSRPDVTTPLSLIGDKSPWEGVDANRTPFVRMRAQLIGYVGHRSC